LVLLFDGLFRFLAEAKVAMAAKDVAKTGEKIDRAYAIVEELAGSLQPSAAPALCENLQGIYVFCMGRLVESNVQQDPAGIDDAVRVLTPLREAFRAAVVEADKADAERTVGKVAGGRGGR